MFIKEDFEVIFHSVKGFSHIKSGLPNQDAVSSTIDNNVIIVCVADGHGSSYSFRSEIGSKVAVQLSNELIKEYIKNLKINSEASIEELKNLRNNLEKEYSRKLIESWKSALDADLAKNPFTEEELNKLKKEKGDRACEKLEINKYLAYGTTLLGCVIHPKFIFSFQLGDGDIVYVDEDNKVEYIIAKDPELIANETTSLCIEKAENRFNFSFQFMHNKFPKLISLSTDGYSNSFVSQEGLYKSLIDYYNIFKNDGGKFINDNINDWLNEVSEKGSGDDITLALIINKIN